MPDSDYCYRVKADGVEADGKSWGDSNTECIAQGASLASIHSDLVQDAIYRIIKTKPLDVWIGLQANSKIIYEYIWKIIYSFLILFFILRLGNNFDILFKVTTNGIG